MYIYIILYTLRISQNHSDGNQLQYSNTTTEPICPCNVKSQGSQRNELLSCCTLTPMQIDLLKALIHRSDMLCKRLPII